jgi:hypothetical protein
MGNHRRQRRRLGSAAADADFFFALGNFEFGDAGFLDQVDQFLQLAQIHGHAPVECCRA